MSKNSIQKDGPRSIQHTEKDREPMRVASRLEGVVKNAGIKEKKKKRMNKNRP
jgi:hypothetical protein